VADAPETKFARLGEDRIAYQVIGEGSVDLVYMPGSGEVVDTIWDYPSSAAFLRRLASFSRLIMFDRRGAGASDVASAGGLADWEMWADDARAVLDAVGSGRAAILAQGDGGPIGVLFAATRPERTSAVVLFTSTARFLWDTDYPWGLSESDVDAQVARMDESWGTEALAQFLLRQEHADPDLVRWRAKSQRMTWSPRAAATYYRWAQRLDVREVLPSIHAPTLVLHRRDSPLITIDHGRYLAQHIPGARFVPLDGANLRIYAEPHADVVGQIEQFLAGLAGPVDLDRTLAAVLFTDIVGSTRHAAMMGDARWRNLLDSHDAVARTLIDQHRGHLVKLTGDGVLARFDGPGRAIRCALALLGALGPLGIEVRAGVHAGEVELRGDDLFGIAVHIAQRVQSLAEPGEVLVSETVPRLVTGSGIEFADRGERELKGVPGAWRLFAVAG
jgi:class 3 adenylate cyclase